MNKNNPINSVYLVTLACVSLLAFIDTFYEAVVFALVVAAMFLFAISIVSMIERIADKHVKFLAYSLIAAALITLLKIIFQYVNISLVVVMSKYIDIAIVPCLLIGIVPIYFEDSFSVKQFFNTALSMSLCFVLLTLLFGAFTEIFGLGSFMDMSLGFKGLSFFTLTHGKLLIIAALAVLFNIVRRTYLKNTRKYRMLVDKYKIQIREIKSSAQRENNSKQGGDK